MRHLVVGQGEVGSAVYSVLANEHETHVRDIEPTVVETDVMHVCYPHSRSFINEIRELAHFHMADLIIVHSTVPPGTCDTNGWVHSPVRGRHPNLADSLMTFPKHFAGHRAREASLDWPGETMVHDRAFDTEAGKLWELLQFGLQVRVEKAIHRWCANNGADFDIVYTKMGATYNLGYENLGFPEFLRPLLEHMPGDIGGHCVRENAHMIDHEIARIVEDGRW